MSGDFDEARVKLVMRLTEAELEWLDGLMLGDGSLQFCRGARVRTDLAYVTLGSAERAWTAYGMSGLSRFSPSVPVARLRESGSDWVSRTPSFAALAGQRLRWYPDGVKRIPVDVRVTPTSLRLLHLGDGYCQPTSAARVQFATCDFARDELKERLVPKMEALGLRCSLVGRKYPYLYVRSMSMRRFFELIGRRSPITCYQYKFEPPKWALKIRSAHLAQELGVSVSWLNNLLNRRGVRVPLGAHTKYRVFDTVLADRVRQMALTALAVSGSTT